MADLSYPIPTIREIEAARQAFETIEPRNLFYRAATELVDLAFREATSLTLAEALAVLLQTWNRAYYQHNKFDQQHFADLEQLISQYRDDIHSLRKRTIGEFTYSDEEMIGKLFAAFERALGPVGAAKCLHLLAPRFFPLWDRAIAKKYGVPLQIRGRNTENYLRFMRITKEQCTALGDNLVDRNPLKAIDEFNYCKITRGSTFIKKSGERRACR